MSSGLSRRSILYEFSQSVLSSASWIKILIAPLNPDISPPTQRHPHLESTKVCAQKFSTIRYFYLLPQIAIGGNPVAPFWGFYVNMCSKTGHRDVNIRVTTSSRNYSQQWGYNERYWCLTPWGLFRVPPTKSDILVVPGTGCDSRNGIQLRKNRLVQSRCHTSALPFLQAPCSAILIAFVLATASRTEYLYGRHSIVLINDRLHV